ncbi:hypothetical protein ACROYT_G021008 [Oculina patagonica]
MYLVMALVNNSSNAERMERSRRNRRLTERGGRPSDGWEHLVKSGNNEKTGEEKELPEGRSHERNGQLLKQRSGKGNKGHLLQTKMNQAKFFAVLFAMCFLMALVINSGNAGGMKRRHRRGRLTERGNGAGGGWEDQKKIADWDKTGEEKELQTSSTERNVI